ncbi:MAG: electron transport complex subunit RsxC [Cellulosilyticaceae bacterium]
MKKYTFKKGIHPNYCKESTCHKPIEILMPGDELVYPMHQHIGVPCTPVVKKGDRVLVGQKIGEANGKMSVPIFSSVSGTIKAVEMRMTHQGVKMQSVVVTNDYAYEEIEAIKISEPRDYKTFTPDEVREIVREAGLVGMGGATFPTYIKLSPPEGCKISHIIINGAECEPYLTSDHRVMLEEGDRLIQGLQILLHLFPEAQAYIGIEDNKQDAIAVLEKLAAQDGKIHICALETKYPQGSEKHLIAALTGREVPSGKLPADVGCIVQNIDSVIAIWRAVTKNRPIMRRIITVAGNGVKNPCNLKVRLGTSYREVLEKAQWDEAATVKIIAGGPMMGMAISDIDIPVVKGTSAILCFTEDEVVKEKTRNCIRCGKCIEVCPMYLEPQTLHHAALFEDDKTFRKCHGMDCIECGSCAYICPAKRQLVQNIRTGKFRIRNQQG